MAEGNNNIFLLFDYPVSDLSSLTKQHNKLKKNIKNSFSHIVYKRNSFQTRSNANELVSGKSYAAVTANFFPSQGTKCSSPVWQSMVN